MTVESAQIAINSILSCLTEKERSKLVFDRVEPLKSKSKRMTLKDAHRIVKLKM